MMGLFSQSVWVEIEQLSVSSNGRIFLIMCFALPRSHIAGHSYCMEVYTTRSHCYGFGQSESLFLVTPSKPCVLVATLTVMHLISPSAHKRFVQPFIRLDVAISTGNALILFLSDPLPRNPRQHLPLFNAIARASSTHSCSSSVIHTSTSDSYSHRDPSRLFG
jgi:hypothetical protein